MAGVPDALLGPEPAPGGGGCAPGPQLAAAPVAPAPHTRPRPVSAGTASPTPSPPRPGLTLPPPRTTSDPPTCAPRNRAPLRRGPGRQSANLGALRTGSPLPARIPSKQHRPVSPSPLPLLSLSLISPAPRGQPSPRGGSSGLQPRAPGPQVPPSPSSSAWGRDFPLSESKPDVNLRLPPPQTSVALSAAVPSGAARPTSPRDPLHPRAKGATEPTTPAHRPMSHAAHGPSPHCPRP